MEFKELIAAFAAKYAIEGLDDVDDVIELDVDGSRVELLNDQQTRSVVACAEIGLPPPDANGAFGSMMLKANFLLRATDGATLCQNPETGEYAIFQAFPLSGLNAESLAAEVARIADKTEHWRNILNAFQVAEREKGEAAAEEVLVDAIHGGQSGFLQV